MSDQAYGEEFNLARWVGFVPASDCNPRVSQPQTYYHIAARSHSLTYHTH